MISGFRLRWAALGSLSDALRGTPPADQDAFTAALELAHELHVVPAVWRALAPSAEQLPSGRREELRRAQVENTLRNVLLREQLIEAVCALNERGIVPLLFKGSLQLVDGTLVALGDRWMIDLDVLVPEGSLPQAVDALRAGGYYVDAGKPFLHPHETVLARHGSHSVIELHTELGSPPLPALLPVAEAWAGATQLNLSRGRALALSPTHQVLHNIAHASLQDLDHRVGGLSLRQFVVLARLVDAHGSAIDWAFVRARMTDGGERQNLLDQLWLAHRIVGMELPPFVRGGLRERLHETRVRIGFALGWLPEVHRNLTYAFGSDYLDSIYAHRDRRLPLALARLRHARSVLRRDGRAALRRAARPKV